MPLPLTLGLAAMVVGLSGSGAEQGNCRVSTELALLLSQTSINLAQQYFDDIHSNIHWFWPCPFVGYTAFVYAKCCSGSIRTGKGTYRNLPKIGPL